jgi:hypothetical protein
VVFVFASVVARAAVAAVVKVIATKVNVRALMGVILRPRLTGFFDAV